MALITHQAEKERFELSNRFTGYTISSRAPSTKLGDFSTSQALPVNNGYFTTGWAARQAQNSIFSFRSGGFRPPRGLTAAGGWSKMGRKQKISQKNQPHGCHHKACK